MGAGFVIFIWLILAGIYGCIFLAFAAAWFSGKKKKIVWLKWLGGILAIGMATLALFVAVLFTWGIIRAQNPQWVFKQTFDTLPSLSISKIQSSFYWFGDTGDVYLRFQTTQKEFDKLVSTNLVKKTAEEMKRDTPGEYDGDLPAWWDYQIQPDWIYYLRNYSSANESGLKGFFSETEYFAYNPKTQTAYYHFIGID